MRLARILKRLVLLAALLFAGLLGLGYSRNHPQDMPWTSLDLAQPIGLFTGRKLAGLAGESARCQALLERAGVQDTMLPSRTDGPHCGYPSAVRLRAAGAREIAYRPAGLGVRCPVAAALALWEWHVVQPAALRHFGRPVAAIDHFGSYSCRRIGGADGRNWSEHAAANAVDIAGFRLSDGRRVSIAADWTRPGPRAAFLKDVRDGACDLFATVLSPDYNRAHRDHLHFDQAARGAHGWRTCR